MKYRLIIHGGAGEMSSLTDSEREAIYAALKDIMHIGKGLLEGNTSAIDTVESVVKLLEDCPLFNAGRGSVMDNTGSYSLDAAIMDGSNLKAGSVCAVKHIKNPISLSRAVMDKTEHVMLAATGAEEFADMIGIERADDSYFYTEKRHNQWLKAQESKQVVLDLTTMEKLSIEKKMGTVGAVAMDMSGNLAAATSTGGITNKQFMRVGDSPLIGAGVYADNETCAISATGYGEQFMRTVISKTIADSILFKDYDASSAARFGMEYLSKKVSGMGGIIMVDRHGDIISACTTEGIIHAYTTENTDITTSLDAMVEV